MKKIIVFCVVTLVGAVLFSAGCDTETNATLSVRNKMGLPVSHFSLNGVEGGDNLLESGVVLPDGGDHDPYPIPIDLEPGKYTWHVEYSEGMMTGGEDGPTKVEIFPGPNDLVLTR